jgi:hypothetical protein
MIYPLDPTYQADGAADFRRVLSHESRRVRQLMSMLAEQGVNLIVSTEELTDPVAECCAELGMLAVQYAEEEDTRWVQ